VGDTKDCACGHPSCPTGAYLAAKRERQARLIERLNLERYVKAGQ